MSEQDHRRTPVLERLLRPESVIALAAIVLSGCGVFIAVYEASLTRRSQRASVWPYVEVLSSIRVDGIDLWVQNNGVGPGRVRSAAVMHGGEPLSNWTELIRRVIGDLPPGSSTYQSTINGRVLPADGERETVFFLHDDSEEEARQALSRLADALWNGEVDVTVCYCSVFEECWTSNLQDAIEGSRGNEVVGSRPVKSCDRAPRSAI